MSKYHTERFWNSVSDPGQVYDDLQFAGQTDSITDHVYHYGETVSERVAHNIVRQHGFDPNDPEVRTDTLASASRRNGAFHLPTLFHNLGY